MILVSHNIVLCKDKKYPASLSKAWHDILRNELNYTGLILTDDLSMGAIKKYTDNISEAVLAVNAGNDILLTSDYYKHYDALMKAADDGKITEETVDKACKRIIAWKFKYLNAKEREPNYTTLIIVASVLGVLILGAVILFLILWLKNRKKKDSEGLESEELIRE